MTNSAFKGMNGSSNPLNIMSQFKQFMGQMKGKNPDEILNNLVSSGQVSQQQLNQVQAMAQQIEGQFDGMKNIFGF